MSFPEAARGFVIFAHGSGSSRLSPRNAYVAERLQKHGMATLLFDLLTEEEALDPTDVRSPTLLIVGGDDTTVLELNRDAFTKLSCGKSLVVVPGATHLFEEPGALDQVVKAAGDWFAFHLQHEVNERIRYF